MNDIAEEISFAILLVGIAISLAILKLERNRLKQRLNIESVHEKHTVKLHL